MAVATPAVSPLRRRMIDDMTIRNLSPATKRSYLHAVAKFSRGCGCRRPDVLQEREAVFSMAWAKARNIAAIWHGMVTTTRPVAS